MKDREIKFRVWDGYSFRYSDAFNKDQYTNLELFFDGVSNLHKPTVQQFIGIKDKNNKDAYIGDIILAHAYRHYDLKYDHGDKYGQIIDGGPMHSTKSIIVFEGLGFRAKTKEGGYTHFYNPWKDLNKHEGQGYSADFEVIGNIFENSELLKTY